MVSLEVQPGDLAENEGILGREILVMTYPFTVVNRHLEMLELNTGTEFWCLFGTVVLVDGESPLYRMFYKARRPKLPHEHKTRA